MRNLWWKDEGLRTRPGIRAAGTPLPDEGGTLDYGGEDRLTGADGGYGRTVLRIKKVNGLLHAALDTIYYDGRLETGTLTSTGSAAESGCLLPVNGCVEAAGGRQENLLLTDAGSFWQMWGANGYRRRRRCTSRWFMWMWRPSAAPIP